MKISNLLSTSQLREDCHVFACAGIPSFELPPDLMEFYQLCGGLILNKNSSFYLKIVGPNEFVPANPEILIGLTPEDLSKYENHPSKNWYILTKSESAQYVSISLGSTDYGYIYNSFWDLHPFDSPLISKSFTEFLTMAINYQGEIFFWDEPGFTVPSEL